MAYMEDIGCDCCKPYYNTGDIEKVDLFMSRILGSANYVTEYDFNFRSEPFYIIKFSLQALTNRPQISAKKQHTRTNFTIRKGSLVTEREALLIALCFSLQELNPVYLLDQWLKNIPGSYKQVFVDDVLDEVQKILSTVSGKDKIVEAILRFYKERMSFYFLEYIDEDDVMVDSSSPIGNE